MPQFTVCPQVSPLSLRLSHEAPQHLHAEVLEARFQEEAGAGGTQPRKTGKLVVFPRSLRPDAPSHHLGALKDGGPCQSKPEGTSLRGGSIKGTLSGGFNPTPVQSWTKACSGCSNGIAARTRKVDRNKPGKVSLFFHPFLNFMPMAC